MRSSLSKHSAYQSLITQIGQTLSSGLLAAQKALEYARLKTYWLIGQKIMDRVLASPKELTLSETLYRRISRDLQKNMGLDIRADTISRAVHFYQTYPVFPEATPLTYSHYLVLQRVKDPADRLRLEQKSIKQNLTVQQLKVAVFHLKDDDANPPERTILTCARGEPFVYCVRRQARLCGSEVFVIDCGFRITVAMPKNNPLHPKQNRIVRSVKKDGQYRVLQFEKGVDKLYTYAAVVTKVVDGDTLDAQIDVGFGIGFHDRFRLKSIDAPESDTPMGVLAKEFVTDVLADCPIIVIRSNKSEMYGRWLADVFYLKGCRDPYRIAREGTYLNQALLDKRLAQLYRAKPSY